MKKQTVLITGGSSGLGYATSYHFARAGYRLLWVSKPLQELEASHEKLKQSFPDVELYSLSKDLTMPKAAREVLAWVHENEWTVDVLINNAGIGNGGYLQETSWEREMDILHLNMLNVYRLTRLFLEEMLVRDEGSIINISSNSSLQPIPRMLSYSSSKAFVKHFTQGLAEEMRLQKKKVHIMCVCPAAIKDTPFKVVAETADMRTFEGLATTTVKTVAADIWKGFQRKKSLVISGSKMRWIYAIRGLLPYRIKMAIVNFETSRM